MKQPSFRFRPPGKESTGRGGEKTSAAEGLARIAFKLDEIAMREFLLLPVYVLCGALAAVAAVFLIAGLVTAAVIFGSLLLWHWGMVKLGLRTHALQQDDGWPADLPGRGPLS